MKYIKTHKQLNDEFINEGLLTGKSLDRIKHDLEGLSNNEKINILIKYKDLYKLLPRNKNNEVIHEGYLQCSHNELTSLPDNLVVNGDLECSGNNLTSLPENLLVKYDLNCSYNNLTSLPDDLVVKGDLYCKNQKNGLELEIPITAKISGKIYK